MFLPRLGSWLFQTIRRWFYTFCSVFTTTYIYFLALPFALLHTKTAWKNKRRACLKRQTTRKGGAQSRWPKSRYPEIGSRVAGHYSTPFGCVGALPNGGKPGLPLIRATGQVILCQIFRVARLSVADSIRKCGRHKWQWCEQRASPSRPPENHRESWCFEFQPGDEREVMGEDLTCQFLMI